MSDNYEIRELSEEELNIVRGWSAKEGWNPGLNDMSAFYKTAPQNFYGGFLDGKLVASLSVVNYGGKFAFLGLYIVLPEHRGKSYGWRLWEEALRRSGCHCMGLDGVVEQQHNYEKSGFKFFYRHLRYCGVPTFSRERESSEFSFLPITEVDEELTDYDEKMFGVERKNFLQHWVRLPQSLTLVAHSKDPLADKKILGYGSIRSAEEGHRVGPLFAQDATVAQDLLHQLVSQFSAEKIFLDVPDANKSGIQLVENIDLEPKV